MKNLLLIFSFVGLINLEGFCVISTHDELNAYYFNISDIIDKIPNTNDKELYLKFYVDSYLAISDQMPEKFTLFVSNGFNVYDVGEINRLVEQYANSNQYALASAKIVNLIRYAYIEITPYFTAGENVDKAQSVLNPFIADFIFPNQVIVDSYNADPDNNPFFAVNSDLGLYDGMGDVDGDGNGGGTPGIPIDGGLSFLFLGGLGIRCLQNEESKIITSAFH